MVYDAAANGAVLTHLRTWTDGLTSFEIGRALGIDPRAVRLACLRLEASGLVKRVDEPKPDSPTKVRAVWFPVSEGQ